MAIKKAQGANIWFDAVAEDLPALTEQLELAWATWTGKWALVPVAGGTAALSGDLTRSTTVGTFEGRVGASETVAVPVGKYNLVCQADNAGVDFSDEFAKLSIEITAALIP